MSRRAINLMEAEIKWKAIHAIKHTSMDVGQEIVQELGEKGVDRAVEAGMDQINNLNDAVRVVGRTEWPFSSAITPAPSTLDVVRVMNSTGQSTASLRWVLLHIGANEIVSQPADATSTTVINGIF